jgi:MFS family permease
VYCGFAFARTELHAWALMLAYGVFAGLSEGAEKAFVADLVGPGVRGRAFGWYNLALGLGALPASVLFGVLWARYGAESAFLVGAGVAIAAAFLLLRLNTDIGVSTPAR